MMQDTSENGASGSATGLSPSVQPASGLSGSAASIPDAFTPGPFAVHIYSATGKHDALNSGGITYQTDAVYIGAGKTLLGGVEFYDKPCGYPRATHSQMLGNAALFIAAPDMLNALVEGRRAIGDHFAPDDCYATGPITGDGFRDLVQCPACSFIAMYEDAIAKAGDTASIQAAIDALRNPAIPNN